jgi:hypothetical protein
MQDLERPELMYRKLGAKLVVGMPFKDLATSDTLILPEVPSSSQPETRRALARLQVGVGQGLGFRVAGGPWRVFLVGSCHLKSCWLQLAGTEHPNPTFQQALPFVDRPATSWQPYSLSAFAPCLLLDRECA